MFGDLGKMMKLAAQMKTKLPELQAKLAASEYEASAGDGAVKAVVNGKFALVNITIDPSVISDGDVEALQDMIKAAVADAQEEAAQASAEAMAELTGGVQLPGM